MKDKSVSPPPVKKPASKAAKNVKAEAKADVKGKKKVQKKESETMKKDEKGKEKDSENLKRKGSAKKDDKKAKSPISSPKKSLHSPVESKRSASPPSSPSIAMKPVLSGPSLMMAIESSLKSKASAYKEEEDCESKSSELSEEDDDEDNDDNGDSDGDDSAEETKAKSGKVQHKDWKTLVITSQQFDGCWDEKALTNILGSSVYAQVLAKKSCSDEKVWTSALALAILELKCMSDKTSWEVVANKGKAYMSKILVKTEKKDKDEILQMILKLITEAKDILVKFI